MRTVASAAALALVALAGFAPPAAAQQPRPVDVDALMARMGLDDKLGQLTLMPVGEPKHLPDPERRAMIDTWRTDARTGAVGAMYGPDGAAYTNTLQRAAFEESEHRIPLLVGNDIIHGYRTIFPIPLATSCSWDLALIEATTRAAAVESRAAGTHWTFAPMIDIARDPRWGRVAESAGEDPYLGSLIAVAQVRGYQGEGIHRPDAVVATAKHFAAYGAALGGRDYDTTDMSEQMLREVYLPPFHAAVKAGVGTLMSSFNDVSGVPATANEFLLQRVLRDEWGFKGFVTSDYTSINELVAHGFARDLEHAGILALNAGCDMDLTGRVYATELADAVKAGRISEDTINRSVRRVLEMKARLGLFENPYGDESREAAVTLSDEHRALARRAAAGSIVLLKNTADILPLSPTSGKIALIGPFADGKRDCLGTWQGMGQAQDAVTLLEGLRAATKGAEIIYAQGCTGGCDDRSAFPDAIRAAQAADVVVIALGEPEEITGEANSRSTIGLPGVQQQLYDAVAGTGKPIILLLASGRPLVAPAVLGHAKAVLATWHLGVEHGNGIADVLFGAVNPSGKLTLSWPRDEGQIPVFYARKNTGRPFLPNERFVNRYRDLPLSPQFPFGHGLSYTTFTVEGLAVETPEIAADGTAVVSATVKNTGKREGAEVVQCYIHDRVASLVQPIRELKGFERVTLKPGESKKVTFRLGPDELGLVNGDNAFVVEPGDFDVYVSTSSEGGLKGSFAVTAGR